MAVLPIITGADNPVLRARTKLAAKVTKEIKELIADMMETCIAANGAGIAAPQVGRSERVCIASIGGKLTALVNPAITRRSDEKDAAEEGCLSLPNVWVSVPRSKEIVLTYVDLRGRAREQLLKDFDARVVQHEVDHLDGVLIVDYQ